jgi:predicted TIM-barrel fold metal-dependent hydrolase
LDGIWDLMAEPYKNDRRKPGQSMFPFDHLHTPFGQTPPQSMTTRKTEFSEWVEFAKELNLEAAVLYPGWALGHGRITNANWAIAATRAYNDWLYKAYLSRSSIFKGLAVTPMQRPSAAAAELRRAVTELGFVGAVLPPNGLRGYIGDAEYWPVYEAANELGCCIAVHGGLHQDMGLNYMQYFAPVHALGHPFGIMISFASLLFNGVFERFPNVRFSFMESGVAWLSLILERFGSSSDAFKPWDIAAEPFQLTGKAVTAYIIDLLKSGRIFVGVEGDEHGLAEAIRNFGPQPFIFSSDFPHEVNVESCKHEVAELLENDEIAEGGKRAILRDNALTLYGIKTTAHAQ